ncbi:carnitine O-acetyltransferase-like [Episyrphus balteatus]|uniref:carnitine O-acetyltransferase-like n=1 Tax=Episyrphus balteatus TaxID=286459 RepID=UPI0024856BB8|nr:carnitine O-acetyltransferase-like [Episyrphus balteatus]
MVKNQRKEISLDEKMQQISRRVAFNVLTKYPLQVSPYVSGVQYNLTAAINKNNRNYATQAAPIKQNLLRYPALSLEETVAKFLKTAEPFLTPQELELNRKQADVFLKCDAPKLQKLLEQAAAKDENWLADRWLRTAYLQYRDPLIIFSSPGMTFPRVTFNTDEELLVYTSKVIYCLIKYKEIIDLGKVPVHKIGPNELDNSQFGRVLGTCRIPQPNEDKVEYNPNSTHVAVVYKNHFYKLPVYSKSLKPLHQEVIFGELKKIFEAEKNEGIPFGILTSDKRDNWATAYAELLALPGNKQSVEEIQKSLFTVSLDGVVCHDPCGNTKTVLAEYLIHGCGSKNYAGNRWFDKTIQLMVSRSGFQGFCYEHSPAEGQPIALMVDYLVKNLDDKKMFEGAETTNFEPSKKLELVSSPAVDQHIKVAQTNLDKLAEDLHLHVLHFKEYGKGFLKQQKLSPDSFIQMALQYAFYKLHKVPGAAYESAHLRIFRNGRTETIRSCSNESMAFAKAMLEPNSDELRVELLRKAVNVHREYTTMALQGRGVDRHLLGLKLMALENNLPIPEFYNLPAFTRSNHFRLSTSQVASVNEAFMCYGPMYHDGYACCYNPRENDMILSLAAWRSNQETCADRFSVSLQESLKEMMDVLCRAGEKPKNKL